MAFPLSVATASTGVIGGSAELTAQHIEEVKKAGFYVQIHTQGNPDGETRGWLVPEEPRR